MRIVQGDDRGIGKCKVNQAIALHVRSLLHYSQNMKGGSSCMAKLEIGQPAPDFALPNQDGKMVRLSDFRGRKLVAYFYPRDNTPGCTREAEGFRDLHDQIAAAGAEVVGGSKDSVSSHAKFHSKLQLPFDLLSDPNHSVLEAYGAWGTRTMYGKTSEGTIRSTVIVDEEGRVAAVFPKVKPDGHAQEVLETI
jgi:peroxiredoxin Q/BCP